MEKKPLPDRQPVHLSEDCIEDEDEGEGEGEDLGKGGVGEGGRVSVLRKQEEGIGVSLGSDLKKSKSEGVYDDGSGVALMSAKQKEECDGSDGLKIPHSSAAQSQSVSLPSTSSSSLPSTSPFFSNPSLSVSISKTLTSGMKAQILVNK